ncbi:hypothetical protein PoMZ_12977 [Pyricularia oryzae]|uniref:Uncharacterized protein n=1 Tax=Pyricularia oryzae TaxID=318829 RepID=A0A4P7NU80_PYROR|nr:hypothetical protein PoMZ_12977 [Pyricularia oryzae]
MMKLDLGPPLSSTVLRTSRMYFTAYGRLVQAVGRSSSVLACRDPCTLARLQFRPICEWGN